MAISAKTIREHTEKLKTHYRYLLDELEIEAGRVERMIDMITAHLNDLEMKELAAPRRSELPKRLGNPRRAATKPTRKGKHGRST